jgi:thiopeptide-type bacteriocin biosynthesis protein
LTRPSDLRKLLDAVINSFEPCKLLAEERGWTVEEVAIVSHLRDVFIAAGIERVEKLQNPEHWLQIGARFEDGAQHRAFLGSDLARTVEGWLGEKLIRRFFFVNKPPGIRLRFSGRELDGEFASRLGGFLETERALGRLKGHELGVYDAETYQFGGEVGLDLCHDFFTYDSLAVLKLLALDLEDQLEGDLTVLSLVLLNDLIARVCADEWERWDVWCNMRLAKRGLDSTELEREKLVAILGRNREVLLQVASKPGEVLKELSSAEQGIVTAYFTENERFARRLADAAKTGKLLFGPRKILPFYVVFHWNRLCFDLNTQVALSFFMQELLNPKGS